MVTKLLANKSPLVTLGNDSKIANKVEEMGGSHLVKNATEICIDEKNLVVTTPAYMLAQNIQEIEVGIDKLVNKIIEFCHSTKEK